MEDLRSPSYDMKPLAVLNKCNETFLQSHFYSSSAIIPLHAVVKELLKEHTTTWLKIISKDYIFCNLKTANKQ